MCRVGLVEASLPIDKFEWQSASCGWNHTVIMSLNPRRKILGESNIELLVL